MGWRDGHLGPDSDSNKNFLTRNWVTVTVARESWREKLQVTLRWIAGSYSGGPDGLHCICLPGRPRLTASSRQSQPEPLSSHDSSRWQLPVGQDLPGPCRYASGCPPAPSPGPFRLSGRNSESLNFKFYAIQKPHFPTWSGTDFFFKQAKRFRQKRFRSWFQAISIV